MASKASWDTVFWNPFMAYYVIKNDHSHLMKSTSPATWSPGMAHLWLLSLAWLLSSLTLTHVPELSHAVSKSVLAAGLLGSPTLSHVQQEASRRRWPCWVALEQQKLYTTSCYLLLTNLNWSSSAAPWGGGMIPSWGPQPQTDVAVGPVGSGGPAIPALT